jgi:hypothetical protein
MVVTMRTTADHGRLSLECPGARHLFSLESVPWSAVAVLARLEGGGGTERLVAALGSATAR